LKPLLKRWFLADGSWKDRPPETKRGKGLELWEMSNQLNRQVLYSETIVRIVRLAHQIFLVHENFLSYR
jgi:hypothetical protein